MSLIAHLRAVLMLVLLTSLLPGADPIARDQTIILPEHNNQSIEIEADYEDADTTFADVSFAIVSQPSHGTVTTLNISFYKGLLRYNINQYTTLPPSGSTSFVWSVTDGEATATATVTIVFDDDYNERPQVADQAITFVAGNSASLALEWSDREDDPVTVTITGPPAVGTAELVDGGARLRYTAPASFTEPVTVRWQAADAVGDSDEATYTISPLPARRPVLVIANQSLYQEHLGDEIDRLVDDIFSEGWYDPELVLYDYDGPPLDETNADAEAIWTILSDRWSGAAGLEGAILIGRLPIPFDTDREVETHDDAYRHMAEFDPMHESTTGGGDIWTSRFFGLRSDGTAYDYGSEATLLRRALDTNHGFRTGRIRVPDRSLLYHKTDKSTDDETIDNKAERFGPVSDRLFADMLVMRDEAPSNSMECGFTIGGHLFHAAAHATGSGKIDNGQWSFDRLHDTGAQVPFSTHTACALEYGGIFDQHLCTRDGAAVVVLSAGILPWPDVAERLDAGCPLGAAYFDADRLAFIGITNHGDLTLRLRYAPGNAMPVIDQLTVSDENGEAPLIIDASISASDPDDAISWIEWFGHGYDLGRATPDLDGATATSFGAAYATPGTHILRVAAFDSYRGMVFKKQRIEVSPNSHLPMRVNGGGPTVSDSVGNRWWANQSRGNWGSSTWRQSDTSEAIPDTDDDMIYQEAISHTGSWTFEMPLAAGEYRLELHFADLENGDAGVNVFDVTIEGVEVFSDLDPAALAGGRYRPLQRSYELTVSDGLLELAFRPDASASSVDKPKAFLNALALLPIGANRAPVITSVPALRVSAGTAYSYSATASDNEGDAISYAMLDGPSWLTLNDAGDGSATLAGMAEAGAFPIRLQVSDGAASSEQLFNLQVTGGAPARWRNILLAVRNEDGPVAIDARCDGDDDLIAVPVGDAQRFEGLTTHEAHLLEASLIDSDG